MLYPVERHSQKESPAPTGRAQRRDHWVRLSSRFHKAASARTEHEKSPVADGGAQCVNQGARRETMKAPGAESMRARRRGSVMAAPAKRSSRNTRPHSYPTRRVSNDQ